MLRSIVHLLLCSFCIFCCNCTVSSLTKPDLAETYNASAQDHGPDRNPVILIPGILGSQLLDLEDNTKVWGTSLRQNANPASASGLRKIALPMQDGVPLRRLHDSLKATETLPNIRLLNVGSFTSMAVYQNILGVLGIGGYYDETIARNQGVDYGKGHFTCFQFPYDWRRSCAENAATLDSFIREKRAYLRKEYRKRYNIQNADIKFDLVAHSMGGLVARYFLRYGNQPLKNSGPLPKLDWRGARSVEKVILVSTPHLGSIDSLSTSLYGIQVLPVFERYKYPAAAVGTFPSLYELMPRPRQNTVIHPETKKAVDLYSADEWDSNNWGILSSESKPYLNALLPNKKSDAERRSMAKNHLQKCLTNAKRFHQALDRKAKRPSNLFIQMFVGDSQKTKVAAHWNRSTGVYEIRSKDNGDGVVPRYSSAANLLWDANKTTILSDSSVPYSSITFITEDHIGITKNDEFINNMLFTLLQMK